MIADWYCCLRCDCIAENCTAHVKLWRFAAGKGGSHILVQSQQGKHSRRCSSRPPPIDPQPAGHAPCARGLQPVRLPPASGMLCVLQPKRAPNPLRPAAEARQTCSVSHTHSASHASVHTWPGGRPSGKAGGSAEMGRSWSGCKSASKCSSSQVCGAGPAWPPCTRARGLGTSFKSGSGEWVRVEARLPT